METIMLDNTTTHSNRYNAWVDAVANSKSNEHTATAAQRKQVQTVFDLLDTVYTYNEHYITWRKKFVAFKLVDFEIKDIAMLGRVQDYLEELGVTKAQSQQGLIYRLPR